MTDTTTPARITIPHHDPLALAKRMYWLAWQACGAPYGMGILQDKPDATEEDVWQGVIGAGDYVGDLRNARTNDRGELYTNADYVFGRMMKFGLAVLPDRVMSNYKEGWLPQADYQMWCPTYPTLEALAEAAKESLQS